MEVSAMFKGDKIDAKMRKNPTHFSNSPPYFESLKRFRKKTPEWNFS
jgi:hypothetical protein